MKSSRGGTKEEEDTQGLSDMHAQREQSPAPGHEGGGSTGKWERTTGREERGALAMVVVGPNPVIQEQRRGSPVQGTPR